MNSYEIGSWGENQALAYLKKQKYKIITSNFKTTFGEIDLIATKDKSIVFVEVKTRTKGSFGQPYEAIDAEKIRNITKTAEFFIKYYSVKLSPQIDVIEVYADIKNNKYVVDNLIHHKSITL